MEFEWLKERRGKNRPEKRDSKDYTSHALSARKRKEPSKVLTRLIRLTAAVDRRSGEPEENNIRLSSCVVVEGVVVVE